MASPPQFLKQPKRQSQCLLPGPEGQGFQDALNSVDPILFFLKLSSKRDQSVSIEQDGFRPQAFAEAGVVQVQNTCCKLPSRNRGVGDSNYFRNQGDKHL